LTDYVFKTTELIFGTIHHITVLSTSVKSIFNKVITQVAQPSDNV